MHAIVCIKQVPDTTEVRIDPKTGTLQREGVPSIMNPYDTHAVEEGLRLRDRYGGKVTVLCMGPPQAKQALQKAISWGVEEAILLTDRAFVGSDTLATSYALAQAIHKIGEREPFHLVLCGKQTIDGDTAQVGPGIATRLGISQLTYVVKVQWLDLEASQIQVERLLEGGREVVRGRLPALLTVVKEINQVRYASLPNMLRAARYQPLIWNREMVEADPKQIGLEGSPTVVNKIFAPPTRGGGETIPGGMEDPEGAASALVEKIAPLLAS